MKRIVICGVQTLFVKGGAEVLVETLGQQLESRGLTVDTVNLPYKDIPRWEILKGFMAWRAMNLLEMHGNKIDMVVDTKFPSYAVKHPNKVVWLVHQYRQAYELYGTPYSDMHTRIDGRLFSRFVRTMDKTSLKTAQKVFTISGNVSARLLKYNNIQSEPLYHPPRLRECFRNDGYGDYLLAVSRMEPIKRVDLVLKAMSHSISGCRCVIVGDGLQLAELKALASKLGLDGRVTFAGRVNDQELIDLYAGCMGVVYAPYDEDYGYVTIEAFLSKKPVITTDDSGGILEFVKHGLTGYVSAPDPKALGACIDELYCGKNACSAMGEAGYELVKDISWNTALDQLLATL
ncbi:MAG: glycosyltransferase [Dehalococcoidia bacterium]|nr:glycosyltransferase [Dehalococcoidia bacterium]